MTYESRPITAANLKSSHFYITSFVSRLPPDIIGGHVGADPAARFITLEFRHVRCETDIPTWQNGKHRTFFRDRTFARRLFEETGAGLGDVILFEAISPYHLRLSLRRKDGTVLKG